MSGKMLHKVYEGVAILRGRGVQITQAQQNILVAHADCANDDGYCWPSNDHLAAKCGMSRRNVQRHNRALEKLAVLDIAYRAGKDNRQSSNLYRIMLPNVSWGDPDMGLRGDNCVTPQDQARGDNCVTPEEGARGDSPVTPRGDNCVTGGVTTVSPLYIRPDPKGELKERTPIDVRTQEGKSKNWGSPSGDAESEKPSTPNPVPPARVGPLAARVLTTLFGRDAVTFDGRPRGAAGEWAAYACRVVGWINAKQIPEVVALSFAGDVRDDHRAGRVKKRGPAFQALVSQWFKRNAPAAPEEEVA